MMASGSDTTGQEHCDCRAEDVDRGLPVIAIHVDIKTLENVLLDGGSGVDLITEGERIQLGLPTPLPAPY
jgi:hypothetical protein